MNISSSYSAINSIGYSAIKNAPQTNTSSKSFTISTQEMPKEFLLHQKPLSLLNRETRSREISTSLWLS